MVSMNVSCERHSWEETKVLHKTHSDHGNHDHDHHHDHGAHDGHSDEHGSVYHGDNHVDTADNIEGEH